MTLEQLRIFVSVAELEHMTRAAEALHITQSAASAAIAALEARHGVALFHRVGRRIELTEAGRIFLAEARAVLGRAESAAQALSDLGELKRGTLRLVASRDRIEALMAGALQRRCAVVDMDRLMAVHLQLGDDLLGRGGIVLNDKDPGHVPR